MAEYVFRVRETRVYVVEYTVEADSLSDAHDKAEVGETVSESEDRLDGVTDREVIDFVREIPSVDEE